MLPVVPNDPETTASGPVTQQPVDVVFELAAWTNSAAPKPMIEAGIVAAFSILGAICQRAYNVDGLGLNLYWLLLSGTGTGKGIVIKCFNKAFDEVAKTVPAVSGFKGPAMYASGQAIISALVDRPYPTMFSCIDEMAHDIEEMSNKRNPVGRSKEKAILQVYSLSGAGDKLDPKAHSDNAKNTPSLDSPSFGFAGTSVAERVNPTLSDDSASSGLLARMLIVENSLGTPKTNGEHRANYANLPAHIRQRLIDIAATSLTLAHNGQVQSVTIETQARNRFDGYDEQLRIRLNSTSEGACKQLSNRSLEKSLKLAAIIAIGRNHIAPCIGTAEAEWAISFVEHYTGLQIAKFATGDVGEVEGNQAKQLEHMRRVVSQYVNAPLGKYAKANCNPDMHANNVFTHKYLNDRLFSLPAFKGDRAGATAAIKRTVVTLVENAELGLVNFGDARKCFDYNGVLYQSPGLAHRGPDRAGSLDGTS